MTWSTNDPYSNRPHDPAAQGTGPGPGQGPVEDMPWQQPPPIPQYVPPTQQVPPSPTGTPHDTARIPPSPQAYPSPYGPGQPQQPYGYAPAGSVHVPVPPVAGTRYADWGERAAAGVFDFGIVLGLTLVLSVVTADADFLEWFRSMVVLGAIGYIAWLNGSKGQSPGKAVMGLRLIRDADGSALGGPVGLLRALILYLVGVMTGGLFLVATFLWPLGERKHRTLHDMFVSGSVVSGLPKAKLGKGIFTP
ncbi:RDD family protein [Ornithinimicrobium sp. Y1694]|uniref:RDD family protein n=1 Tax=Ornithinimicrobium sp. Y1694 TaxID=3418590 RepID=UPI003CF5613B